MKRKQIVIVGGGITGLTAAYYLKKQINEDSLPYDLKLVEASGRLGGKISTYRKDGFIIERGPDSFLERKKAALTLAKELGLEDQLVRNQTGQAYILVNDKLRKIPPGSFMGIPTSAKPFLFSGLFSVKGKLRAGLDYVLPKGKQVEDQSLGLFFRQRFGDELVENLIEPLLSGIYSGDIDDMSLMATFPNFYHLQKQHGSLIKGLKATVPAKKQGTGKRPGQFLAFKQGFETIVEVLERQLGEIVSLNSAVDHIEKKENHYHVLLSSAEVLKADAVIVTSPHTTVPKMLSQYEFLKTLNDIPMSSVANIALVFDEKAIKKDMDGTGFVVSRNSKDRITACTWTHKKWPHTTPDNKILLRAYVGKPTDQDIVDLSDEEIEQIVLKDLNRIMKIKGKPKFSLVTRFKNVMPQYTVGHLSRISEVKNKLSTDLPGIFITGSSYEGVGIPDCMTQAEKQVNVVLEYLAQ